MWARIPAMLCQKIIVDQRRPVAEFHAQLPPQVRWKADNYNHLMEQPTLFYAVALTLTLLGADDAVNLALAWGYVGLRVVHSLVQATVNVIVLRFAIASQRVLRGGEVRVWLRADGCAVDPHLQHRDCCGNTAFNITEIYKAARHTHPP